MEETAFHQDVREAHNSYLDSCVQKLGFHSLRTDARAAGADWAIRVTGTSSWGSSRQTIYRSTIRSGASGHPVFAWRGVLDFLGDPSEDKNQPRIGMPVPLDQQAVAPLGKILSANDIASLPANAGEEPNVDGSSLLLEMVDGERYLWRYRKDSIKMEESLSAVVTEVWRLVK